MSSRSSGMRLVPCATRGASVICAGAVSALGAGEQAYRSGNPGEIPRVALGPDRLLELAGLAHPITGRVPLVLPSGEDRSAWLLRTALRECLAQLDDRRPGWREGRVGLCLGTSSGGMSSMERFFAEASGRRSTTKESAQAATYFGPFVAARAEIDVCVFPCAQVLGACASSTLALGVALRWLELGRCDLVLAGGYDGLSEFVASGFESLRATTRSWPRPFRVGRDGLALGEGAAVLALALVAEKDAALAPRAVPPPLGYLLGFSATSDAFHITAPERTGRQAAIASLGALADAGVRPRDVDLVSAHATATTYNDAAESRAIGAVFGSDNSALPLVHPFKAQIGHALGAAGALETLAALDALARSVAPGAAGQGQLDADCAGIRMLERAERRPLRAALKTSAAFGGINAALALSASPGRRPGRRVRPVRVKAFALAREPLEVAELAGLGVPPSSAARWDLLTHLSVSAVFALRRKLQGESFGPAGIVVGHSLATLETNAAFDARRRSEGPQRVEPRRFPYTSPNATAGECAIAFGLQGPSFGMGSALDGWREALLAASDLCSLGDADRMLVVAVDEVGPLARSLLEAAGWPTIESGACAAWFEAFPVGSGATENPADWLDRGGGGALPASEGPGHRGMFTFLTALGQSGMVGGRESG